MAVGIVTTMRAAQPEKRREDKGGPKIQDRTSRQNVVPLLETLPPPKADFHENQADVHELQPF